MEKLIDLVKDFFSFFIDKSHRFSTRAITLLFVILTIISIDIFLGLSDNFFANRKIDNIIKIEKLLDENKISTKARKELIAIENRVISQKSFWQKVDIWYSQISDFIKPESVNGKKGKQQLENKKKSEGSFFFSVISSGWSIVILMILAPFLMWSSQKFTVTSFVAFILLEIILYILLMFFAFIISTIPTVDFVNIYFYKALWHFTFLVCIGLFIGAVNSQIRK